ncbi:MAG: TetR family transcriptional regulator [Nocardioides sp.]
MTTAEPAAEHRQALGRTLRELRSSRGLTLRDLAALLEVSPATLSAIETGKTGISSERIARLAEALDVPVQRVFATSDRVDEAVERPPRSSVLAADLGDKPTGEGDWRSFPPLRLDPALDGALSSFVEFGYHGASMRTIAERAHLSVPGLYHYYASKQEMLVALLDLTMEDLRVRTRAARDEGGNAVERFALIVECLALYHTHRRELAFVGASEMRSLERGSRDRVAAVRREEQRVVDSEVEAAVAAGDFRTPQPHEAARAVVTMCTALAQWFRDTGPASSEQVAAQYVDFALDLVQCTAARPRRHVENVAYVRSRSASSNDE